MIFITPILICSCWLDLLFLWLMLYLKILILHALFWYWSSFAFDLESAVESDLLLLSCLIHIIHCCVIVIELPSSFANSSCISNLYNCHGASELASPSFDQSIIVWSDMWSTNSAIDARSNLFFITCCKCSSVISVCCWCSDYCLCCCERKFYYYIDSSTMLLLLW